MNKSEKKLYESLKEGLESIEFYDEANYLPIEYFEKQKLKLQKKDTNLHIGLINIPCEGFGDIVNCGLFYQNLKLWYPNIRITICTSELYKFKTLKFTGLKFIELHKKKGLQECGNFGDYKMKGKIPKFDIIGVVPLILSEGMYGNFILSHLQKLIPYANHFNTFTVSEYNGQSPPYTFPLGVGEGQVGILLMDMNIPKQTLIQKPYALAYIQHSSNRSWGPHSNKCILSYIEMICKKYKKHKKFQIIIPNWFCSIDDEIGIFNSSTLKTKLNKIIKKYFKSSYLLYKNENNKVERYDLFHNEKSKLTNLLIFRGDILPQPRKIFISLIKDSVDDILLTGDQSITDALSVSKMNKRIWYQTAPWKQDFSDELSDHIPNKYLGDFHTTCGTLKSIHYHLNNKQLIQKYDFRKLGKKRMDAFLFVYHNKEHPILKYFMNTIEHSRLEKTALVKYQKEILNYY